MTKILIDEATVKLVLEAYLCREMPAGTIIGDPKWWVPKIAMALREALAQTEQQGWQSVPMNPTTEMIAALGFGGELGMVIGHAAISDEIEKAYTAMLAVAPQPTHAAPVSGVVIRDGWPSLLQDRNIKPTDQRLYTSSPAQRDRLHKANKAMLEALEEIALAGMSGSGHESEEGMTAWHAQQAWKFINIAARAIEAAHGITGENT